MNKLFIYMLLSSITFAGSEMIKPGKDYESYSNKELRKRVWKLEKVVAKMQRKLERLEDDIEDVEDEQRRSTRRKPKKPLATWICKLSAHGENFSATGASKAVAESNVIEKCSKEQGDSFFCKNATCTK